MSGEPRRPGATKASSREGQTGRADRSAVTRRPAAVGRTVVVALLALAVAVGGGTLLWLRISEVQQGQVNPELPPGARRDPATRARGAAVSISGKESRPWADYDAPSGTVTVRFQSKYYDAAHTAELNRQYLATEGRLVVQLVLYNSPDVGTAVAQLYNRRKLLATVTGSQSNAYAEYKVEYAGGLP